METVGAIAYGQKKGFAARAAEFVRRWPTVPLLVIALLAVSAIFAPWVAPHDPVESSLRKRNIPPVWYEAGSMEHILGTDPLGRDLLSRIIYGARVSLAVAAAAVASGLLIGTTLGLMAGYIGGLGEEAVMRLVDVALAVPGILLALVVVAVAGQSFGVIILVLTIFSWTGYTRLVRAEVLHLKVLDYVSLARVAGASPFRIIFKHIFPGVINTVVVISTLQVGGLILTESVLSYLGAGIAPPTPSWGSMVADGRAYLTDAWWVAFFPGMAILLTVLAMNFLGDWLRDRLDPRLRQL